MFSFALAANIPVASFMGVTLFWRTAMQRWTDTVPAVVELAVEKGRRLNKQKSQLCILICVLTELYIVCCSVQRLCMQSSRQMPMEPRAQKTRQTSPAYWFRETKRELTYRNGSWTAAECSDLDIFHLLDHFRFPVLQMGLCGWWGETKSPDTGWPWRQGKLTDR